MIQTELSDLYSKILVEPFYDKPYDLSLVVETLQQEILVNQEYGKTHVLQFAKILKGLGIDKLSNFFDPFDDDCFYTTFTENDRELKYLIDTIGTVQYFDKIGDGEGTGADDAYRAEESESSNFHSLTGDDVMYGGDDTDNFAACSGNDILDGGDGDDVLDSHGDDDIVFGGAGNDIIHTSDGNDIIFGGEGDDIIYPDHSDDFSYANDGDDIIRGDEGNDTIYSMVGNDTFIFNLGDGQDTVYEYQGVDTFYFGNGIAWEDLTFTQNGDDMVISINNTTDQITVKDWFAQSENGQYGFNNHKIEIFQFADGSKHYKDEITVGDNTEAIVGNKTSAKITSMLAQGILSGLAKVTNCIEKVAQVIRDHLPHSPAKTGPLKDLHKVKIVETIAQTIKPLPLQTTMAKTLNTFSGGLKTRLSSSNTPSTPVVINYNPTINCNGNTSKDEFAQLLKQHKDEILKIFRMEAERKLRVAY